MVNTQETTQETSSKREKFRKTRKAKAVCGKANEKVKV